MYAEKLFKKTTLYVVRTDGNGNFRNSAPCKDCSEMITKLNIKRIVFSTDTDFEVYKPLNYSTKHVSSGNRHIRGISNQNHMICSH